MKTFCVCGLAALCMLLAGCGGNGQEAGKPEPVEIVEVPSEESGPDAADLTSTDQFTGVWQDSGDAPCTIEIRCEGEGSYTIAISWSRSSQEKAVWELTGTYDEVWEGIAYMGAKYEDITSGDGTVERRPVPEREEITGLLYLEDDGTLQWTDDFDHAGDDLSFAKES